MFAVSAIIILAGVRPTSAASTDEDVTFEVNVKESLSVSITRPSSQASGNVNDFLRNDYAISVSSNNAAGFTATMYADTNTYLVNGTNQLQTLSSSATRGSFPADRWGYSLGQYIVGGVDQGSNYQLNGNTYGETSVGTTSSNYYPLTNSTTTPITIISAGSGITTASQNIYFGAKGSYSTPAGTYQGTVVVSVVSGVITDSNDNPNNNPVTPVNPDTPATDVNNNGATYTTAVSNGAVQGVGSSSYSGTTVYSTTSNNTTTTEVSGGDNTALYANPHGEQYTSSATSAANVANNNLPATGLLMLASVTAATGILCFALAKRDDDDDDEEENGPQAQ